MAPNTPATDRYLTPPQVARIYGLNPSHVRILIERGELRAVDTSLTKGGKPRWKVAPAWLAEFEAARSNTKPTPAPTRAKPRRAGRRYL